MNTCQLVTMTTTMMTGDDDENDGDDDDDDGDDNGHIWQTHLRLRARNPSRRNQNARAVMNLKR